MCDIFGQSFIHVVIFFNMRKRVNEIRSSDAADLPKQICKQTSAFKSHVHCLHSFTSYLHSFQRIDLCRSRPLEAFTISTEVCHSPTIAERRTRAVSHAKWKASFGVLSATCPSTRTTPTATTSAASARRPLICAPDVSFLISLDLFCS